MTLPLTDALTRFLFSREDFKTDQDKGYIAKERALRPPVGTNDWSVFNTTGDTDTEIWATGAQHVLPERKLKIPNARIHARADFNVKAPIDLGLTVKSAEPPPRHCVIESWPEDKDARIELAQVLAAHVFIKVPEAPIG